MKYKDWIEAMAGKNFVSVIAKNRKGIIYESYPPVFRDGKHHFHVHFRGDVKWPPSEMVVEEEIQLSTDDHFLIPKLL